MRDERRKKERSKQRQTNKQGKATQHTQGSLFLEKCASGGIRTHATLFTGQSDVYVPLLLQLAPLTQAGILQTTLIRCLQTGMAKHRQLTMHTTYSPAGMVSIRMAYSRSPPIHVEFSEAATLTRCIQL